MGKNACCCLWKSACHTIDGARAKAWNCALWFHEFAFWFCREDNDKSKGGILTIVGFAQSRFDNVMYMYSPISTHNAHYTCTHTHTGRAWCGRDGMTKEENTTKKKKSWNWYNNTRNRTMVWIHSIEYAREMMNSRLVCARAAELKRKLTQTNATWTIIIIIFMTNKYNPAYNDDDAHFLNLIWNIEALQ